MKLLEKKEYASLACYLLLLICAAFALSYPLAFRAAASEPLFVGEVSYETLLEAQNVHFPSLTNSQNTTHTTNSLHPAPFSISNYIYAALLTIIPPWALPALLSFFVLSVLWFTLSTFPIPLSARFIAVCMFAFSPLFVATQLSLGLASLLFICVLLFLLSLRLHWHPIICSVLALVVGLFGVEMILLLLIILFFSVQRAGHAPIYIHKRFAIVGSLVGFSTWLGLEVATKISFTSLLVPRILNNFFVDFGAQSGQTLLLVILALIGAVNIWKKELRWPFVGAIAIIIWSTFFANTALFTTAIFSYFAGSAFTKMWNSKWTYFSLKLIVLVTILLAVLTSYFVFSNQLIIASPTTDATNAYSFILQNTPQNAVIFSTPHESAMVAFFAQRQVINTNNPLHAYFEERQTRTQRILYAKTLSQALAELQILNVTHILIDPNLQSGDQWREDLGGLALLLRNKHAFTLLYDQDYLLYSVNYEDQDIAKTIG